MLFPTFTFFAFFIPALALTWYLKRWPLAWRISLLLLSYFFYSTWSWPFLAVLVALTATTFLASLFVQRRDGVGKAALIIGIVLSVGTLFIFKYYDFFRVSFEGAAGGIGLHPSLPVLEFLLPIGLSFYILRCISYLVDIRNDRILPATLLDFSIYIAFFPQLLSGPIARPGQFLPQLENGGAQELADPHGYFGQIILGLFKKLVVASYFTAIADAVLTVPTAHSPLQVLLAVYAYALVIYCDFSGYSDMAIGIAGLMGFVSPMNFNSPYAAVNVQEIWRRWHISFSEWLRDYVYIPLGGSRTTSARRSLNLFATMLVSGLWHGAGLTYIIWGGIHGAALLFHRLWQERVAPLLTVSVKWLTKPLSLLLTFHFMAAAWMFFRAPKLSDAFAVFQALFGNSTIVETISRGTLLAFLAGFVFLVIEQKLVPAYRWIQERVPFIVQVGIASALIILTIEFGPDIVPSFIYFQF